MTVSAEISTIHRPKYHFLPAKNWMNDPNGLIHWKGQYHLFYQHNPHGALWGNIGWGHAVSSDLVHWEHLPLALQPSESYDSYGCFSGCTVDNNGVPTFMYTGTVQEPQNGMEYSAFGCVATSTDDLLTWQKYAGNPVIEPPAQYKLKGFRDHNVWREGDEWRQIIGSGIEGVGPTAFLYRSTDLLSWELLHPLYVNDGEYFGGLWVGNMWECPQLLKFGQRSALIVGAHDGDPTYGAYLVGSYENDCFAPDVAHRLDYGGLHFYASQSLVDATGRTLMWGWSNEGRSDALCDQAGWSGIMSLPRVVTMRDDDRLSFAPAPELEKLRGRAFDSAEIPQIHSRQLEIKTQFWVGQDRVGLQVLAGEHEHTTIFYDPVSQTIGVDRSASTVNSAETHDKHPLSGELALEAGELLTLHIFVDHSIIEIFANGIATITARVYPACGCSDGVAILNPDQLKAINIWELGTIW